MRSALKEIKKINDHILITNRNYILIISNSTDESNKIKQSALNEDVTIILELFDVN